MLSFAERMALLEKDLNEEPPRINAYHDLPFALLHYNPMESGESEFFVRGEIERLRVRLEGRGLYVAMLSLGSFFWEGIHSSRGLDAICDHERETSFETAQEVVSGWFSDEMRYPLPIRIAERINAIQPVPHAVFLYRAGVFGPNMASLSSLLKGMHRRTTIPAILFYPGVKEGEWTLRYMGLPHRDLPGSYHVRIY